MTRTDRLDRALRHPVWLDFLEANQTIAALETRLAELRVDPATAQEAAQCHRALIAVRVAFDVWPRSEADLDAAHEAAMAEMDALAEADVPVALR